jgi:GNAT superfamily N-acetyltransferase
MILFKKIDFKNQIQIDFYKKMCQALYNDGATQHPMNPEHINRTLLAFETQPYLGEIILFWGEENIVGYASLSNFWSNEWGGNILHIDELFVEENHRGKGITHTFFEWLDQHYKQKNLAQAYALEVSPQNPNAQKLYEKLGFIKKYYNYMIKGF